MVSFHSETVDVSTRGRGTYEITEPVARIVAQSRAQRGLCTVFVHHTSASLIITENADDQVRRDLDAFLARLVPDGDPLFRHIAEGPDDMPAHVRAALTQSSLSIPIERGRCALGTWQGLYLWEHRYAPYKRRITVSIVAA